MRHARVGLSILLALALAAYAAAIAGAAVPAAPATPEKPPSANKGKTGTYECKTSNAQYNYYVYVPKSYSDENPAGLHLYFHGQNGGGGAPNFGQWAKYFLDTYNLIGINMQYTDGDNAKDSGGKVEAAVEAIRQTCADYKIVFGRGAVGSFSGGGIPHEKLLKKFGRTAAGGPSPCPFNHSAPYDSNFWADPAGMGLPPMSWFIGLGTKEWDMGKPTLGTTQPKTAEHLFGAALKGACPDVYLKITKDKGHSMSDDDVRESAVQFHRSDLAFAPFIYERDFAEPALAPIVRQANGQTLGKASAALDVLLAGAKTDAAVKAKAEVLRKKFDERIEALFALTQELTENDAILANFYGNLFAQQLGTHPKAKEIKALLADLRKKPGTQAAIQSCMGFWANFHSFLQGPALTPAAPKFLEDVKTKCGEKSLVGKMATEMLGM